jgi:hypothetical protein
VLETVSKFASQLVTAAVVFGPAELVDVVRTCSALGEISNFASQLVTAATVLGLAQRCDEAELPRVLASPLWCDMVPDLSVWWFGMTGKKSLSH